MTSPAAVIIPTRDRAAYLDVALASIAPQSGGSFARLSGDGLGNQGVSLGTVAAASVDAGGQPVLFRGTSAADAAPAAATPAGGERYSSGMLEVRPKPLSNVSSVKPAPLLAAAGCPPADMPPGDISALPARAPAARPVSV